MQSTEETKEYIANLFKARFPILYIQTWEEKGSLIQLKKLHLINRLLKLQEKYIFGACHRA